MLRILLVDDDADHLNLLVRELMKENDLISFQTATNAADAMALLAQHRTTLDAIVSDLNMPEQSGFELVAVVRSLGFRIPFFIVTADNKVSAKQAAKFGVNGVFHKPIRVAELIFAIEAARTASKSKRRAKKSSS